MAARAGMNRERSERGEDSYQTTYGTIHCTGCSIKAAAPQYRSLRYLLKGALRLRKTVKDQCTHC